jgi:3-oxoacyl-[acyl-carrier-protein] synthase-1
VSGRRAVITGLGFLTSLGNTKQEVSESLRTCRTGVELFEPFADPSIPVKLAGRVKGFNFPGVNPDRWDFPGKDDLSRGELRTFTPNAVYAWSAMRQAIADAALPSDLVSHPSTGLFCSSAGSSRLIHAALATLIDRGVQRMLPGSVVAAIPNSLHANLVARFAIKGSSLLFSSACSSSAHALGAALDEIRLGRQNIIFAVGAEDCDLCAFLPFAALRALSPQTDPERAPCPFDVARDGFVATGGATALVVEELEHARARGATCYAELAGWGQASDGYDVVLPDPTGDGLARAMQRAIEDAGVAPHEVGYINAHATGTGAGDAAEITAIRRTFRDAPIPRISSTKALSGHGLSLAGAMEAGFCCLALKERFIPVSAHIQELDPAFADMPIVTAPTDAHASVALSNSSGFGGSNVTLVLSELR